MAETLDRDKLDAKLSAHNADLSFADSYKMFETRAAKIETHFEQAGENLQATFPDLHAAVKEYLDSKKKQGQMLEKAANVLRVPDNTKVRKIGPPRLNTLNEPFGAPKVLNSQDRIAKLEELKKVADAHNQQRLDKIAQNKQKCAAKKAQAAQQRHELNAKHGPVLAWLKGKNFCTANETKINKAHLQAAFVALKERICQEVRAGGEKISKSTPMHQMIDLFIKYKVTEM